MIEKLKALYGLSITFTTSEQDEVKLGSVNRSNPLELYEIEFEQPFISATHDYYVRETTAYLATHRVSEFMKMAQTRIEEEISRGKKYLHPKYQQRKFFPQLWTEKDMLTWGEKTE